MKKFFIILLCVLLVPTFCLASDSGKKFGGAFGGVGGAGVGAYLGTGVGLAVGGTAIVATLPFAVAGALIFGGAGYIIGDNWF
jgi:hypothetical protein